MAPEDRLRHEVHVSASEDGLLAAIREAAGLL
jgi:hypothetical protein